MAYCIVNLPSCPYTHLLFPYIYYYLYQLVTHLHKYGMSLEPKMKYPILEDIGKHFIDRAAAFVKSGRKFVYVLDNIDWEEKAHDMRQDVQNKSVHALATSIVFHHISDQG